LAVSCSPVSAILQHAGPVRWAAADGRNWACVDVQSPRPSVRRDQPGAGADHRRRHLRRVSTNQGRGYQYRAGRTGYRSGDEGRRPHLLFPGGPNFTFGPSAPSDARSDSPRLFWLYEMTDWLNALVQGILLGGLYALFAAGLSLIFGVMRLVNLAHGDLIVLAAFAVLTLADRLGLDPFAAVLVAMPILFAAGFALQHVLLNRTLGRDLLPPLLVTFG